jgi:hypothetical protein
LIKDETSSFFKNILHAKSVSGAVSQKQHGVHTVFVDFGNTKIEVKQIDHSKTKTSILQFSSYFH